MADTKDKRKFMAKLRDALNTYIRALPAGTGYAIIKGSDMTRLGLPEGYGFDVPSHILDEDEIQQFLRNGFFKEGRFLILQLDQAKERKVDPNVV